MLLQLQHEDDVIVIVKRVNRTLWSPICVYIFVSSYDILYTMILCMFCRSAISYMQLPFLLYYLLITLPIITAALC